MIFTGTYEHSIDAKNRLAIPAELRDQLHSPDPGTSLETVLLYATLGEGQVLCLYPQDAFERRAAELDRSELDADQLLEYERLLFSLTRRVEVDKQGRVRLPEQLLKRTGLGSDVVLIGVKDHIEIHDRQRWQDRVERLLAEQPQILMNPRRAMRRQPGSVSPPQE